MRIGYQLTLRKGTDRFRTLPRGLGEPLEDFVIESYALCLKNRVITIPSPSPGLPMLLPHNHYGEGVCSSMLVDTSNISVDLFTAALDLVGGQTLLTCLRTLLTRMTRNCMPGDWCGTLPPHAISLCRWENSSETARSRLPGGTATRHLRERYAYIEEGFSSDLTGKGTTMLRLWSSRSTDRSARNSSASLTRRKGGAGESWCNEWRTTLGIKSTRRFSGGWRGHESQTMAVEIDPIANVADFLASTKTVTATCGSSALGVLIRGWLSPGSSFWKLTVFPEHSHEPHGGVT